MPVNRFAEILSPAYRENLQSIEMNELRRRKASCHDLGEALSYLRRLVQGRHDIVRAELEQRVSGKSDGTLSELIENLPKILSGELVGEGSARLSDVEAVPDPSTLEGAKQLYVELEGIAGSARLANISKTDLEELRRVVEDLHDLEQVVSARRRAVFRQLDAVDNEVIRRYQTGEATVDALLS